MKKLKPPKGFGKQPRHILLHPEVSDHYDAGKAADIKYFQAHPGVTEFVRRPYPGEAELTAVTHGVPSADIVAVEVKLLPGMVRVRSFLTKTPIGKSKTVYLVEGKQ